MTNPARWSLYHGGFILGLDHAEIVDQALPVDGRARDRVLQNSSTGRGFQSGTTSRTR